MATTLRCIKSNEKNPMKKIFLFLAILFITQLSIGQNTDLNNLVEKGIKFHDKGEYAKAIIEYKKALILDPNSSLVNYEIAFSYLSNKEYVKAEKHSKKAIELKDNNLLPSYITYANSLDLQGKSKKAIKVYEKAIKEFDNYLLYYNYGYTCLNQGKLEKAYSAALKAIEKNSSHGSSHLLLSEVMNKKGERIKAMLPLYFFLLIEPNSSRSAIEYKKLRNYLDQGVKRTSENKINISIPMNNDSDFGAVEMMVSLAKASNSMEENINKDELDLFAENNETIFKILGELKKDNTGFWWDLYVPFFYELANQNLVKPYSYYISLSKGEKVTNWIEENDEEFEKFKNWLNQ